MKIQFLKKSLINTFKKNKDFFFFILLFVALALPFTYLAIKLLFTSAKSIKVDKTKEDLKIEILLQEAQLKKEYAETDSVFKNFHSDSLINFINSHN